MGIEPANDLGAIGQRGQRRLGCKHRLFCRSDSDSRVFEGGGGLRQPVVQLADTGGHANGAQQLDLVVEPRSPRPCGLGLGIERRELGSDHVEPLDERRQTIGPGGRGGDGIGRSVGEVAQAGFERAHLSLGGRRPLTGELGHLLVDPEIEQRDEQVLAGGRLVMEEASELTLRQDHALGEVVVAEPEAGRDCGRDLVARARDDLTPRLEAGLGGVGAGFRTPHDARRRELLVADREVEPDACFGHALRDDRSHGPLIGQAGHVAVQREHHGVEHRRLAASGCTTQCEQVSALEVDDRRRPERGEALHLETYRPHGTPASSYSSSNNATSAGSSTSFSRR